MARKVEVHKMDQFGQALSIRLDDGRTIVARPRPEDQDYLAQAGGEARISVRASGDDTEGHGISNELTIDVEGHAMTLRLPTPADAEALRKALIVGAMTATIVAAGAIASMQGSQAPAQAGPGAADRAAGPGPRAEFQLRREQAADKLLEAPPPLVNSVANPTSEREFPAAGVRNAGASSAAGAGSASNVTSAPAQHAQVGPDDDVGLADKASQAAAAEFAAERSQAGPGEDGETPNR